MQPTARADLAGVPVLRDARELGRTGATAAEAAYDYTTAGYPVYLAADYIANSGRSPGSKPVLDKINGWVKTKTTGNPAMVVKKFNGRAR